MPLTIRQILSKTPPSRRQAAEWVKVTEVKVKKSPRGFPLVLAKTIAVADNKGVRKSPRPQHKYVTTIEVLSKGCIVSCSCDDFKYTWEYALTKRGSAVAEYSNGEPPVDRNPSLVPGGCKHIYAMASQLIEAGKL